MSSDGSVDLDAVIREAADAPAVETGDIEEATFQINRYLVNGDGVETVEEDTGISDEEVDALREEIQSNVSQGLEEIDSEGAADQDADATQGSPDETSMGDPGSGSSAVETARRIVSEEGITSTDYIVFRTSMLGEDFDDDTIQEVWADLRDEGAIGSGGGGEQPAESSDSGGGTVTVGGEEVDVGAVDGIYMLTTTGCAGCQMAKDQLEGLIEDDLVEPINIQESDLAADVAVDLEITATPTMVVEVDGEFHRMLDG